MARLRFHGHNDQRNQLWLLLGLGAVTGLALGVAVAVRKRERAGGAAHALDPVRERVERLRREAKRLKRIARARKRAHEALAETSTYLAQSDSAPDYRLQDTVTDLPIPHFTDVAELEARVLETFRNDPMLKRSAIDIGAIGDGVIELTGWVHSDDEMQRARVLARGVPGVVDVLDSLTMRGTDVSRVGQTLRDR